MASRIESCRSCGSRSLEEILSLGDLPPVNSFLSSEAEFATERRHPLAIAFCPGCAHVQLTHQLDPRDVFTDYIYFSSMSETIVRWGQQLAARYAKELSLAKGDLVAELASNDGCILKPFGAHCRTLGIEPAKNIAEIANREGVRTLAEFFDRPLGERLRRDEGPARLIIARNVLAHVPDLVGFVRGVREWLADDGIFHVEVPYLRPMLEGVEFDTIYHEHLSYFSVTALERLFREAGLVLWDVEEIPLHGGSLIVRGRRAAEPTANVRRFLAEEAARGLTGPAPLRRFAGATRALKDAIPEFLHGLKQGGRSLAAYGAAAKGVVLANYCGLDASVLDWVADRSPYKQGKWMPGVHLKVVAPDEVFQQRPDHLLVLAWNFFDEIARQLDGYRRAGGQFVLPLPRPHLAPGG